MTTNPKQKLVPIRATRAMQEAGAEAQDDDDVLSAMANIYRAMIEASPAIPSGEQIELETTPDDLDWLERALAFRNAIGALSDDALDKANSFIRDFAKLQARAIPSLETPEERR